jgi:hypothetical protein
MFNITAHFRGRRPMSIATTWLRPLPRPLRARRLHAVQFRGGRRLLDPTGGTVAVAGVSDVVDGTGSVYIPAKTYRLIDWSVERWRRCRTRTLATMSVISTQAATSRSSGSSRRLKSVQRIVYDNFKGGLDRPRKNSAVAPAAVQYVLTNAYCTTGYSLKKRPCLTLAQTLEPGTAGLKAGGGKLNTFYESGTITHANPLFVPNKAPHPSLSQPVTRAHFGEEFNGYLYAALEYADGTIWHQYFDGTAPPQITDANCPQTASVRKLKQKIYARSGSNVRFCKTAAPRDWTTALDAGLSRGRRAGAWALTRSPHSATTFRTSSCFSPTVCRIGLVDPDPANMTLVTTAQLGTAHNNTAQTLAGDLIFLSKAGFRSVSNSQFATTNLQESDVGSPIDSLRGEIDDTDETITVFLPAARATVDDQRRYRLRVFVLAHGEALGMVRVYLPDHG